MSDFTSDSDLGEAAASSRQASRDDQSWWGEPDPVELFAAGLELTLRQLRVDIAGLRAERDGLRLEVEGLRAKLGLAQEQLATRENLSNTVRQLQAAVGRLATGAAGGLGLAAPVSVPRPDPDPQPATVSHAPPDAMPAADSAPEPAVAPEPELPVSPLVVLPTLEPLVFAAPAAPLPPPTDPPPLPVAALSMTPPTIVTPLPVPAPVVLEPVVLEPIVLEPVVLEPIVPATSATPAEASAVEQLKAMGVWPKADAASPPPTVSTSVDPATAPESMPQAQSVPEPGATSTPTWPEPARPRPEPTWHQEPVASTAPLADPMWPQPLPEPAREEDHAVARAEPVSPLTDAPRVEPAPAPAWPPASARPSYLPPMPTAGLSDVIVNWDKLSSRRTPVLFDSGPRVGVPDDVEADQHVSIGRRLLKTLMVVLGALVVVVLLAVSVGPRFLPYQTYFVRSGSMEPTIHTGAMVVLTKVNAEKLAPGDIITFGKPGEESVKVTHRIVEIETTGQGRVFITKGDANGDVDSWRVPASGTGWKYSFNIPYIGFVFGYLGTPGARIALLVLPALVLGLLFLLDLWKPKDTKKR